MDLVEFIHESNNAQTKEELTQKFLKFLESFGIDRFIMGQISHDTTALKEKHLGLMVNYPPEWMSHYVESHYVNHDPVYQTALTARRPFTWEAVEQDKHITKKARLVMDEARENKLYGGIGLSIHRPLGSIIGMGFAGSEKGVRSDQDAISMIYAAANQYFIVYADLTKFDDLDNQEVQLTARESEVLHWLARGKTKSEVSDILSISESSIKRHCESIFRKLGVNNIQLAIAKSLRMGLVKPF